MDDTSTFTQGGLDGECWLLLLHQLPPKPDYLRVKVRRRLRRIGAVAIKSTVYLLPATDEAREDFQWLRTEIQAEGGSAVICPATFIEGLSDEEIHAMLDDARPVSRPDVVAGNELHLVRLEVLPDV